MHQEPSLAATVAAPVSTLVGAAAWRFRLRRSLRALDAVNLFMADVRDGLGPFLAVFLQGQGWSPAAIGLAMTTGGLAGMVATTPAGALVDAAHAKRALLVACSLLIPLGSLVILFWPTGAVVIGAQVINALAGALIPPALAGLTLGLVGQQRLAARLGRNEAWNHGGNVLTAAAVGLAGWLVGISAVFWIGLVTGACAVVAILMIDPGEIDHKAARGLEGDARPGRWLDLLRDPALVLLALVLALFHLGNAAMLPLLGQRLVSLGAGSPSAWMAACIIIAQLTMIPVALLAARGAQRFGYRPLILAALLALPLRGALAAGIASPWGLIPIQMLDGLGAGILGVAVPGLVAVMLRGTGHYNLGLGAVMTVQGVGAALSTALGGLLVQWEGYATAFLGLGAIAGLALALFLAVGRYQHAMRPPGASAPALQPG